MKLIKMNNLHRARINEICKEERIDFNSIEGKEVQLIQVGKEIIGFISFIKEIPQLSIIKRMDKNSIKVIQHLVISGNHKSHNFDSLTLHQLRFHNMFTKVKVGDRKIMRFFISEGFLPEDVEIESDEEKYILLHKREATKGKFKKVLKAVVENKTENNLTALNDIIGYMTNFAIKTYVKNDKICFDLSYSLDYEEEDISKFVEFMKNFAFEVELVSKEDKNEHLGILKFKQK